MNYLIFGGVNTADYGVYINHDGIYNTPERAVETVEVPGRNGLVVRDLGRFQNVSVVYELYAESGMKDKLQALRQALMSQVGYQRLEDTFRPEEFRMARFTGETEVRPSIMGEAATLELTFDCKPQRYLKSGETEMVLKAPGTIWNPGMESLPVIRVWGYVNDAHQVEYGLPAGDATLTVGGVTIQFRYIHNVVGLDCETQDAFYNSQNQNGCIYAPVFPSLKPGLNEITWTGNISGITLYPRWWTV